MLVPNRFNNPAPDLMNPNPPIIPAEICRSGVAPPSAIFSVLSDPISEIGALILAVVPLAFVVTSPANVSVPVPVIEVPVILTEPTVVMLFAPNAKTPELTSNPFVIPTLLTSVTVLFPPPPVLAIVRFETVPGKPSPAD